MLNASDGDIKIIRNKKQRRKRWEKRGGRRALSIMRQTERKTW